MNIEEIKAQIAKEEKALSNPKLMALMGDKIQAKIDGLKKQLSDLEGKAEKKIESAEKKVDDAETKSEKKEAEAELKEAKKEAKEVEKVSEKVDKVEKVVEKKVEFASDIERIKAELAKEEKALSNPKLLALMGSKIQSKIDGLKKQLSELEAESKEEKKEVSKATDKAETISERIKRIHGGKREGAGRKPVINRMEKPKGAWGGGGRGAGRKKKASTPTKMVKPTTKIAKISKPAVEKTEGEVKKKSVRAFGQTVTYTNDGDFCRQLIKAFKKRRLASKKEGKRRKTKPVFGVITTSVKNAVSKALHSVPKSVIEDNPKQFLAKATRLEKSAIRFLEDFKNILGSDFKKAEITSEFGELETAIKQFVAKFSKKDA